MAKAEFLLAHRSIGRIHEDLRFDEDDLPLLVTACARIAKRAKLSFPVKPDWWKREAEWFTEWDEILFEAFRTKDLRVVWRYCIDWLSQYNAFRLATAYARLTHAYFDMKAWEDDLMSQTGDSAKWLFATAAGVVAGAAGAAVGSLVLAVPGGAVAAPYVITAITARFAAAGAKAGATVGEKWADGIAATAAEKTRDLDEARAAVAAEYASWFARAEGVPDREDVNVEAALRDWPATITAYGGTRYFLPVTFTKSGKTVPSPQAHYTPVKADSDREYAEAGVDAEVERDPRRRPPRVTRITPKMVQDDVRKRGGGASDSAIGTKILAAATGAAIAYGAFLAWKRWRR